MQRLRGLPDFLWARNPHRVDALLREQIHHSSRAAVLFYLIRFIRPHACRT
jgi:hypothetical protein